MSCCGIRCERVDDPTSSFFGYSHMLKAANKIVAAFNRPAVFTSIPTPTKHYLNAKVGGSCTNR